MDPLDGLGQEASVQARLRLIHDRIKEALPAITRVAIATYDSGTDVLRTFVHSTDGEPPFTHYDARLAEVPSLAELARAGRDRIIDDLTLAWTGEVGPPPAGSHNRKLVDRGYRSSYTKPFYDRGRIAGFMFFDSPAPDYFSRSVVHHLSVFTALIGMMIAKDIEKARELRSAVQMAKDFGHVHDAETGGHLERMAHYAEVISRTLAAGDVAERIDDEFVEFVFLFAPLHDIGKIGIPDKILLKEGRLTKDEFTVMQTHVSQGVDLINSLAQRFDVSDNEHVTILRNIVAYHHEAFDGGGYPNHLTGRTIPLEARIITVADVFDALTSKRSYKLAWSNDRAFEFLRQNAGSKFDPACVDALIRNAPRVARIQERFAGDGNADFGFHEAYTREL
jgi:HD-GYP domain-containing protein (c-di-GMP phosphodiesterase class II)